MAIRLSDDKELVEEYKSLLISYYEGREKNKIKTFLKDKCFINI